MLEESKIHDVVISGYLTHISNDLTLPEIMAVHAACEQGTFGEETEGHQKLTLLEGRKIPVFLNGDTRKLRGEVREAIAKIVNEIEMAAQHRVTILRTMLSPQEAIAIRDSCAKGRLGFSCPGYGKLVEVEQAGLPMFREGSSTDLNDQADYAIAILVEGLGNYLSDLEEVHPLEELK